MASRVSSGGVSDRQLRQEPLLPKDDLPRQPGIVGALDRYFSVSARGSNLATEWRAGTTGFLATCNNFVVNAQIMQMAGVDPAICVVSSAFASGCASVASGLLSNLPLGLVTSVGPNVFIAYSLVAGQDYSLDSALAISATSGLLLAFLSVTPLLTLLLGIVPLSIKYGLVVGTGLLTAFIGLKSIGVVVADDAPPGRNNIVALGDLTTMDGYIFVSFLVLTTSMLHRAVKGSVLIGMLGATIVYWIWSGNWPERYVYPCWLTFYDTSFLVLSVWQTWLEVGALLLMLLFSISGSVLGCARMAGLLVDGYAPGSTAVYLSSGLATVLSAYLGSSPVFVSMSAAAGIRDGGRTGLVSIVIGIYCFLTAFLFSPLASAIPHCATAPVLVLVGVSMVGESKEICWWNMQEALPAFLCAVFMPFTYSVSNGIYAGVSTSALLFLTTGSFVEYLPRRARKIFMTKVPVEESTAEDEHSVDKIKSSLNLIKDELREQNPGFWYDVLELKNAEASQQQPLQGVDDSLSAPSLGQCWKYNLLRGAGWHAWTIDRLGAAAALLGFDGTAVRRLMKYKLGIGGARNGEAHCFGGIPGYESKLAFDEICGTDYDWVDVGTLALDDTGSSADEEEKNPRRRSKLPLATDHAPNIAALARLRRDSFKRFGNNGSERRISMSDIGRMRLR